MRKIIRKIIESEREIPKKLSSPGNRNGFDPYDNTRQAE